MNKILSVLSISLTLFSLPAQAAFTGPNPHFTSIIWNDTTKGIKGTATNDSAAASYVGEYLESVTGTGSVGTSAQYFDITTITITAGDWDVSGSAFYNRNGATVANPDYVVGIGSTTGNSATNLTNGVTSCEMFQSLAATTDNVSMVTPIVRIKSDGTNYSINGVTVSGSQVVRLKGLLSTYSVTVPTVKGTLRARRVR